MQQPEQFWNDQYADPAFAYGKVANEFPKSAICTSEPGRAVIAATGEGRVAEYAARMGWSGNVAGSINIPKLELAGRLEKIGGKNNIIFCCASGARSEQAAHYLQANGIECKNGGPRVRVNHLINQTI